MQLGALDYISKPVNPPIVLRRVAPSSCSKRRTTFLQDKANYLEQGGAAAHRRSEDIQEVTVLTMFAGFRDPRQRNRPAHPAYPARCACPGVRVAAAPRFASYLSDAQIELLFNCLHREKGIPDRILLASERLTPKKWRS